MSASEQRQWGVRLADVRITRYWLVSVLMGIVLGRLIQRREIAELSRVAGELGSYVGTQNREAAEREARLIALTKALLWLTVAVLAVAIASIVVSLTS